MTDKKRPQTASSDHQLLNTLLTDQKKAVVNRRRTGAHPTIHSNSSTRSTGVHSAVRPTGPTTPLRQTAELPVRPTITANTDQRTTGAHRATGAQRTATPKTITAPRRTTTAARRYSYDDDLYVGASSSLVYTAGTNVLWVFLIGIVIWLGMSMWQSQESNEILSSYYQSSNLRAAAKVIGINIPPPDPIDNQPKLAIPPGEASILGVPTVSAERIDEILRMYGSPATGTGALWVQYGEEFGIDPVFAIAFFMHESHLGTNPNWAGIKGDGNTTHNVGNIICAGYPTCFGRFRDYPDWAAGIRDWYRLIAVEYVEGRGLATVEGIIPVYAPSFENDVPTYINSIKEYVTQWRQS